MMHQLLLRTLILTALLGSRAVDAQTTGMARSPAVATTAPAAALPPPDLRLAGAPIGHRQPRMRDVLSETPATLETIGEEDRAVDRKLTICRGC